MKNIYLTELKAVCPITSEIKTYAGIRIVAESWDNAEEYCKKNGLCYLNVIGKLIAEVNFDLTNYIDYDFINPN